MSGFNLSLLWVITVPMLFVWALGVYLVVKGWGRGGQVASVEPVPEESPVSIEQPIPEKKPEEEPHPQEQVEKQAFHEIEVASPAPKKEEESGQDDFYRDFGKANIIEFPAEYIDENSVRGLDGTRINFVKFAKTCYTQIGFKCIEMVYVKELADRTYMVSIFDLISDHYAMDEEAYIDFFGENKERLSEEIASLKNNPEFVFENAKKLRGEPENLPQLIAWDDKELFLVSVRPRHAELAQKEINWLKSVIIEKKLIKAKIFKITERKIAQPTAPAKPLLPPESELPAAKEETRHEKITRRPFSEDEIKFIEENRDRMTNEEIADKLGRSLNSITHKLSRMGISRESFVWSKTSENFLKNNFTRFSYHQLARKLGTTTHSVRARCKKLGMKK